MIPNTSNDPVANVSFNTAMSKVIEENVCTLFNQVKELQQRVIQLEGENTHLKEQLETSKPMKNTLDDFRKCALEKVEDN